ncbi:MAG: ABC transporter substrate-binding protein, partial [Actinomycetota bacterium]|nr:ABC transporter substrate-binding protein [Actinomycetota bacterium]
LSRAAVRDVNNFLSQPTGNGPFQIAEPWGPGESVTLEAFPGFIETPDLAGIRFLAYPDAAASWVDFVRGELDVAEVPAGQIRDAEERFGTDGFKPFLKSEYYGFNLRSPALQKVALRKAVNRAIDRREIARTIFKGTLAPPRGLVPTGMPGFQENICVQMCNHAPRTARSLVKRLEPKARRVVLEYTKGGLQREVALFVARDLRAAGLRVAVKGFRFPAFLRRLRAGDHAVYRLGWIAEYPVPDAFLTPLFESTSPDNHSGFASAKVDALLAEARRSSSDGKRLQLYIEAEKAIMRSVPVVPLGSFETHWAAQNDVRRLRFDVMGGFDAAEVFLAP